MRVVLATTNRGSARRRTEELLGATALLNDFNKTGLQLFDGGNVVGEDTHLTGLGGNVDLDTISRNCNQSMPGKGYIVESAEDRNVHVGGLEKVL